MKKFSANYLISDTGAFLKNGIIVCSDEGDSLEYIDTTNDLKEIAQLAFYSGILMANFSWVKSVTSALDTPNNQSIKSVLIQQVAGQSQVSIQNLIELAIQIQLQFPLMKINEIFHEINCVLSNEGFSKQNISGIFLLNGVDLVGMKFTLNSRLKKIC